MLHKSKSKQLNLWKYTLVIPFLALFLMSFSTKEVIVDKLTTNEHPNLVGQQNSNPVISLDEEIELITISKDFSKKELVKAEKQFSKLGVTLNFSGIKRNTKNEITAIKANFKTSEGSNGNYAVSGNKAIRPFTFFYNSENGEAGFGTPNKHMITEEGNHFSYRTKDGTHKIQHSGKGSNVFVFSESHEGEDEGEHVEVIEEYIVKDKEGKHKVHKLKKVDNDRLLVIKEGGQRTEELIITEDEKGNIIKKEIIKSHSKVDRDQKVVELKKGKNKVMFSNDSDANPLIYIDGKKSSQEKMDAIDPDAIETISILKGKDAIEKYGKKAKDGVIEITLKK